MTRAEALTELKRTGVLTTALLEPLRITMDSFLRYAQLPPAQAADVLRRLTVLVERQCHAGEALAAHAQHERNPRER